MCRQCGFGSSGGGHFTFDRLIRTQTGVKLRDAVAVLVFVLVFVEVQRELAARLETAGIVTELTLAAGATFGCQGKGGTEERSFQQVAAPT